MIRILRLVTVLTATLAALIAIVLAIGATQPSPILPLFTDPDGSACQMPCLFGVRPGVTLYKDAVLLLHSHPLLQGLQWNKDDKVLYGKEVEIRVFLNPDDSVNAIGFLNTRDQVSSRTIYPSINYHLASLLSNISLGQFVVRFVNPDYVHLMIANNSQLAGGVCFVKETICAGTLPFQDDLQHFSITAELQSLLIGSVYTPYPSDRWKGFSQLSQYR
ncbi:MAG: hypothetical protein ABI947_06690 [Chloroflexota bacterium]